MQPNDRTTPRICWEATDPPVRREFRRHLPTIGAVGGVGAIACGLIAVCVLSFQNRHVIPDQVATSDFAGSSHITVAGVRPTVRQTHVLATDSHGVETRTPLVVGAAFAAPVSRPAVASSAVAAEVTSTIRSPTTVAPAAVAFAEESRGGGERRWSILHDGKRSQFQSIKARSTDAMPVDGEPPVDGVPVAAIPEAIPVPTSKTVETAGKSDARRTTKVVRSVNLRSRPGGRGLGTIKRGTVVSVGRCDEWCEVVAGGRKGFVYRRFLGRIS